MNELLNTTTEGQLALMMLAEGRRADRGNAAMEEGNKEKIPKAKLPKSIKNMTAQEYRDYLTRQEI